MNIKTVLKSSVAAAALVAIAAPAANAGIKNSNKNSLTVGGYVAKSLMYLDDGDRDQLFITDGSTSESRVRWIASGKLNENVSAGAGIEMEIPLSGSNPAATLRGATTADSGAQQGADRSDWQIRHQFVWVSHKKFGKLSLGNTNAAGNGSAEARLGGTGSLDNTNGKPFGSGVSFVENTGGTYSNSGVTVGGALSNFDMTSRTDVIRYDAPKFAGLGLAASLNSGGGTEIAGKYSGKFGGVKVLAKAGWANLSATSTTLEDIWAVSGSALHDSGLSVGVGYGENGIKNAAVGRDDPSNISVNLGYQAKIFGTGKTYFNVQWVETSDLNQGDEATSVSFTALQKFDAIGANVAFNVNNIEYETSTFSSYDDITTIALQTVFNF